MSSIAQLPIEVLQQQIGNGLILLGLGMGVVFVFLVILIFSTKIMSKIVGKITKNAPVATTTKVSSPVMTAGSQDTEVAIAIAAAVQKSQN